MSGLSDRSIREQIEQGRLKVDPYDPALVQPASLDMRLDRFFMVLRRHKLVAIDPYVQNDSMVWTEVAPNEAFILHPGEFVLGSTYERIELPDDLIARVEGKSSLGRLGLLVHITAGFIDPGFRGHITLEFSNAMPVPIKLWPGMNVAQMSLTWLDQPAERPYGQAGLNSKYKDQRGPTASRYYLNPRPEGLDFG
jgi:dCTP deaminase